MYIGVNYSYQVFFPDSKHGIITGYNDKFNTKINREESMDKIRSLRFKDIVRFAKHRTYDYPNMKFEYKHLTYPEECFARKEISGDMSYDKLVEQLRHSLYVVQPRPDFGNINAAYDIMVNDLVSMQYIDLHRDSAEDVNKAFYEHKDELIKCNMDRRSFSVYSNGRQLPDIDYGSDNEMVREF